MAEMDQARGNTTWPMRWMLVHLAMNSGLRVSEIAALKIGDLHLDAEQPYIYVGNGKGGKSRDVYIDKELVNHLKEFIYRKSEQWKRSFYNPKRQSRISPAIEDVIKEEMDINDDIHTGSEKPLFQGNEGNHYTTTALNRAFKQCIRAAKLRDDLSIHSARHTYATLLLHKTKNLRFVQKQLGHALINMTALYADVMPEENGKLANQILDDNQNSKPCHHKNKTL